MTDIIAAYPRSDIMYEIADYPLAENGTYSSPYFDTSGISSVYLNVFSNHSGDGDMYVVWEENTLSSEGAGTTQTTLTVNEWSGNSLFGGTYYYTSNLLPCTSGQFQFLVGYYGTYGSWTFNASVRIASRLA